jgi:hypothetical protein
MFNKSKGDAMKKQVEGSEKNRLALGAFTKLMRAVESVNQQIDRLSPLRPLGERWLGG